MTTFIYTAKKSSAETVTGKITAQNQDEAIELINQLGLLPVRVEPDVSHKNTKRKFRKRSVRNRELFVFSRQLANLIKSGVSLVRALSIIEDQTQNLYFQEVISSLVSEIKNGKSFSESLKAYPKIFSSLYITMVHAGEESGNLQHMLFSIASYQHKQEEILSRVRSALIYPLLMAFVGAATIYFILTFVLPRMSALFKSIGQLPLPTVVLLKLSFVLSHYWVWFFLGVLTCAFFLGRWAKTQKAKIFLSGLLLKLPLFGGIVLKTELARFSRTLVLLMKSGVSIVQALEISIPILSNEVIKKHLLQCKDDLTSGGSFGESLKQYKEIPAMMGHLLTVGEESGNLEDVLKEIADTYEQETDELIKTMTTLFEPVMILVVGLVVGFMVFAMLLPIFQIDILAR